MHPPLAKGFTIQILPSQLRQPTAHGTINTTSPLRKLNVEAGVGPSQAELFHAVSSNGNPGLRDHILVPVGTDKEEVIGLKRLICSQDPCSGACLYRDSILGVEYPRENQILMDLGPIATTLRL